MVVSPDEALSWLVEGNERYAQARFERPNQGVERRSDPVVSRAIRDRALRVVAARYGLLTGQVEILT